MAKLKNYTTSVPANRSIMQIQEALAELGASGVAMKYEDGLASGVSFSIRLGSQEVFFDLPIDWRAFKKVMAVRDNISKAKPDTDAARSYAHRVAWRCARDWVLAQVALISTEMVTPLQVFLPYAVTSSGKTVGYLLTTGESPLLLGRGR